MAEALLSKTPLYFLKDTVTVILNMGAARAGSLVQLPEGHEFLLVSLMGALKSSFPKVGYRVQTWEHAWPLSQLRAVWQQPSVPAHGPLCLLGFMSNGKKQNKTI